METTTLFLKETRGGLLEFTIFLQLCFHALGALGKNGFSGYPYITKDDNDDHAIETLTNLKGLKEENLEIST